MFYYTFWTMLNTFIKNYFLTLKNFEIFRTSEKKIGQIFFELFSKNHAIMHFRWLLTLLVIIKPLNIPADYDIIFHKNIKKTVMTIYYDNDNLRNPGGYCHKLGSPQPFDSVEANKRGRGVAWNIPGQPFDSVEANKRGALLEI